MSDWGIDIVGVNISTDFSLVIIYEFRYRNQVLKQYLRRSIERIAEGGLDKLKTEISKEFLIWKKEIDENRNIAVKGKEFRKKILKMKFTEKDLIFRNL